MCCGFGFGGDVNTGGLLISSLKRGDEILLDAGHGCPETEDTKALVIFLVDGFSAVCTDGTRINCNDGNFVTKTGNRQKIKITRKLINVLLETTANDLQYRVNDLKYKISNDIYTLKYNSKKFFKKTFKKE